MSRTLPFLPSQEFFIVFARNSPTPKNSNKGANGQFPTGLMGQLQDLFEYLKYRLLTQNQTDDICELPGI